MSSPLKPAEVKNLESQARVIKFPRSVPLILLNEFCERFSYYGMRAILVLYLTHKLGYEENGATMIYHIFTLLVYFFCLIGAIVADSFIGKFKTILWLSIVYAVGSSVLTVGACDGLDLSKAFMTFVGLSLIAIGSGGIKPCVAAFGAEQFKLPEQEMYLAHYFSLFYFFINMGSLLSTIATPLLREDVQCFDDDCYAAGFGLPAVLMIMAVIVFISGKFWYKIIPSQGNMLLKVCSCIRTAISTMRREKTTKPREHWLDYSELIHGKKLVLETKILLNVLVLFTPLPIFWSLFDQQGSRWTFQATKMQLDLGFYKIKPDQMQVINPLLILMFIPLVDYVVYPFLHKIFVRRPLQKMTLGGILAGVAFLMSAFVQMQIDNSDPKTICVLWQIPQYVTMTLGEVMFSVTGLEFSFTQAPKSMKSVIAACWLLTSAFGNLLVIVVVGAGLLSAQAFEFLLFAVLMFIDMIIFMFIGFRYQPISLENLGEFEHEVN